MKCTILFLMVCSLGVSADSFVVDKTDPALAGMSPALLARIPARMKEFVDAGKTAGIVAERRGEGGAGGGGWVGGLKGLV